MCPIKSSMVSPSLLPPEDFRATDELNELGNLREAAEYFTQLISSSSSNVCLHCSVPTWSCPSDTCLDLHDLHELRSRSLLFIHTLLESLRSCGIVASYQLSPSDSSLCVVSALRPETSVSQIKAAATEIVQRTKINKRKTVWLMERGPSLIIT